MQLRLRKQPRPHAPTSPSFGCAGMGVWRSLLKTWLWSHRSQLCGPGQFVCKRRAETPGGGEWPLRARGVLKVRQGAGLQAGWHQHCSLPTPLAEARWPPVPAPEVSTLSLSALVRTLCVTASLQGPWAQGWGILLQVPGKAVWVPALVSPSLGQPTRGRPPGGHLTPQTSSLAAGRKPTLPSQARS